MESIVHSALSSNKSLLKPDDAITGSTETVPLSYVLGTTKLTDMLFADNWWQ
jgi:hypothetical protein